MSLLEGFKASDFHLKSGYLWVLWSDTAHGFMNDKRIHSCEVLTLATRVRSVPSVSLLLLRCPPLSVVVKANEIGVVREKVCIGALRCSISSCATVPSDCILYC